MELIQSELISLLALIITTCVGIVTKYVVGFLNKKGIVSQIQNNKEMVKIVVYGIEQAYSHLNGEGKLQLAKKELLNLMENNKIKLSEEELDLMIEAMVLEVNRAVRKELNKEELE